MATLWIILAITCLGVGGRKLYPIINDPSLLKSDALIGPMGLLLTGCVCLIFAISQVLKSLKNWEVVAAKNLQARPFWYGLYIATGYAVIGSLYILFSTEIAHVLAQNAGFLKDIELIKGYLFIGLTSLFLFIFIYFFCEKIVQDARSLLAQKEALAEATHQATAGILASSIAHDAGNILACLRFCLELLKRAATNPEKQKEIFPNMANAINELSTLNKRLLQTGQQGIITQHSYRNLVEEAYNALSLAKANTRTRNCHISLEGDKVIFCYLNPHLLHDMLLNLILNAADATNGEGNVIIYIYKIHKEIYIEVHDNGPGIPMAKRSEIFNTFYTTKHTGSGLGLLTVKTCAELHHGIVEVDQSPLLGGALFRTILPCRLNEED